MGHDHCRLRRNRRPDRLDAVGPGKRSSFERRAEEMFPLNQCAQCGADIIAAQWSEHVSEHCIRNVWSCDACGYQFEDTVYLSAREIADA